MWPTSPIFHGSARTHGISAIQKPPSTAETASISRRRSQISSRLYLPPHSSPSSGPTSPNRTANTLPVSPARTDRIRSRRPSFRPAIPAPWLLETTADGRISFSTAAISLLELFSYRIRIGLGLGRNSAARRRGVFR